MSTSVTRSRAALVARPPLRGGATMWCVAPEWPEHARHVAVEFVHPVIVGKRALPAVSVESADPVAALRSLVRPGDVVLAVSTGESTTTRDDHAARRGVGCHDHLDRGRRRPPARRAPTTCVWVDDAHHRTALRSRRSTRAPVSRAVGADPRLLRAPRPAQRSPTPTCVTATCASPAPTRAAWRGGHRRRRRSRVCARPGVEAVDTTIVAAVLPATSCSSTPAIADRRRSP